MALWPLDGLDALLVTSDMHGYTWCKITSPSQVIIETSDLFWFQSQVLMWTFCAMSFGVLAKLFQAVQQGNRTAMTCYDQRHTNEASLLPGAMAKSSKLTKRLSWAGIFWTRLKLNALGIRPAQLTKSLQFFSSTSQQALSLHSSGSSASNTRETNLRFSSTSMVVQGVEQTRTDKAWVDKMKMHENCCDLLRHLKNLRQQAASLRRTSSFLVRRWLLTEAAVVSVVSSRRRWSCTGQLRFLRRVLVPAPCVSW